MAEKAYQIRDVVNAANGLGAVGMNEVPYGLFFELAQLYLKLRPLVEIYQRQREAIIRRLGVLPVADGQREYLDPDRQEDFERDLKELQETLVSLDVKTIPWAEFKELPGMTLEIAALCHILIEG